MASTYHEYFTHIPAYVHRTDENHMNKDVLKWSNKNPVPAIGDVVEVSINKLGAAVVKGYFEESGWLGLIVDLVDAPDWHKRQNGNDPRGHVFGAELKDK